MRRARCTKAELSAALLVLSLAASAVAFAQAAPPRGLVSPLGSAPLAVVPGGTLSFVVEAATGLSPPPGIQEERAHRAFSARLCAEGIPFGAPERLCFALPVRNVRPLASHSLSYRVDVPVPRWLAPWSYDLGVRFPGGADVALAAVRVGEVPADAVRAVDRPELAPAPLSRTLRVHVGAGQLLAQAGGRGTFYPLPDERGAFAGGVVVLMKLPAGVATRLQTNQAAPRALALAPASAQAGQPVWLEVPGAPAGADVFWWLGGDQSAAGRRIQARFVGRLPVPVQALVIERDGRASRVEARVPVRVRRVGGCALASVRSAYAAGLLLLAVSWKLGRRRHMRARAP